MPRKSRKKLIAVAVALSLIVGPTQANIRDSLDAMWYSSAGGTIAGSNGMGLYGPSLTLRSPNKTYEIAYFDPPRLSSGCSGIDMTFGSFSMLSGTQFKDLVRKIMQAAPGYLMQLAIKAMCEDCSSVMQNLQSLANSVNSGQINSCRISSELFNALAEDVGAKDTGGENTKAQKESLVAQSKSYFDDAWGALNRLFTSGDKSQRAARQSESTDYGNTFINTFYTANAQEKLDFAVLGGEREGMQILQSLIGTTIIKTAGSGLENDANASSADEKKPALLTFNDLVEGAADDGRLYYRCESFDSGDPETCQGVNPTSFKFLGIKRYLIAKFAGEQPTDATGQPGSIITQIEPNSIMGKYRTGEPLSNAEMNLLAKLPIGLQKMMYLLQDLNEDDAKPLYDHAFQVFAEHMTAAIAISMVNAVNFAYSAKGASKKTVSMSDEQKSNVDTLKAIAQARMNSKDRVEKMTLLSDAIAKAQSFNGSSQATH